jgi:hypothetical protein
LNTEELLNSYLQHKKKKQVYYLFSVKLLELN